MCILKYQYRVTKTIFKYTYLKLNLPPSCHETIFNILKFEELDCGICNKFSNPCDGRILNQNIFKKWNV